MRTTLSKLIAAAVAFTVVLPALGDPLVYEMDMVTGKRRSGLRRTDVRAIGRFVRAVEGIDHHVQQIDGLNPPDVEVLTGRDYHNGDAVYLRKVGGRWTLIRKLRWRNLIEGDATSGTVIY